MALPRSVPPAAERRRTLVASWSCALYPDRVVNHDRARIIEPGVALLACRGWTRAAGKAARRQLSGPHGDGGQIKGGGWKRQDAGAVTGDVG